MKNWSLIFLMCYLVVLSGCTTDAPQTKKLSKTVEKSTEEKFSVQVKKEYYTFGDKLEGGGLIFELLSAKYSKDSQGQIDKIIIAWKTCTKDGSRKLMDHPVANSMIDVTSIDGEEIDIFYPHSTVAGSFEQLACYTEQTAFNIIDLPKEGVLIKLQKNSLSEPVGPYKVTEDMIAPAD